MSTSEENRLRALNLALLEQRDKEFDITLEGEDLQLKFGADFWMLFPAGDNCHICFIHGNKEANFLKPESYKDICRYSPEINVVRISIRMNQLFLSISIEEPFWQLTYCSTEGISMSLTLNGNKVRRLLDKFPKHSVFMVYPDKENKGYYYENKPI
jgi:hypothetical protein